MRYFGNFCLYQTPSKLDAISKQNLIGLNLEFSFSETACHTKAKEPSLPYHFNRWERIVRFILFHSAMWNANSLVRVLNSCLRVLFQRQYPLHYKHLHFRDVYTTVAVRSLTSHLNQHPTEQQLYGHLPPISKTIQIRRTRYVGHCWGSKNRLISDILPWTPSHGTASVGRPAGTYRQNSVRTQDVL